VEFRRIRCRGHPDYSISSEATNALVGILEAAFLPWRALIAELAPGTNSIFQSPEPRKLGTAIKREALTRKGR